jgi:hypothetical protein
MLQAMTVRKKTASPASRGVLEAGILLLPGAWWEGADKIEEMVRTNWAELGRLDLECRRGGGGRRELTATLRRWSGRESKDVVLTVGLSGHLAKDIAPDVTGEIVERRLPGIEEAMALPPRRRPEDLLFRGRSGIRGKTVIINLPERRGALQHALNLLAGALAHALEKIAGDETECGGM